MAQCEYFVLRYVPDLVKNEFVNFGMVMLAPEKGFAGVRFAKDLRRVQCFDANADIEVLHALEDDFRKRLADARDRREFLQMVQSSFSGTLQLSDEKTILAESPESALEELARQQLEPAAPVRDRREPLSRGRTLLRRQLRNAFTQAGVASLVTWNIPAAKYTHAGDPLKLDCGYRPDGTLKLFHAVSLTGELESAKALAFSYPRIAAGIEKVEKTRSKLTAIVESALDRSSSAVAYAFDAFAEMNISVATSAELPALAETARKELRV